ncbi:16S rRNA (uracil(1498)-N(3))-methyltransferase [Carbonactinospora thermoautotrophica]|uniref:Ribosomal RNA small subunit methyltransferase E n=1 Tax=Carbonactinospora thermoautotrophica TaxID=1469144 RepID=A0A132MVK7_9ACTN|nr:16S rRNA (uracil(1498)-N(3))-methyltransferase [Carbonactinospora thermoautotrophica]KWX00100.1 16S rRNA methyltransferase [Carbonactinospora thermoautotrophica]KWX01948.1 Ribosomal RNA small subunit methyltransferase E [Carbonactinospora thermoautotrophica]KWX09659.1 16S rRNA methyltransferase [Carbonactinospora thermoautotrophica]MCX9189886.1 16S rRNA (uracil(1498)-N(3))-methyltransferase [Carbonactinospora thermoautotrophica]
MSPPVFLVARERLVAGDRVLLDGSEGRHAATVRRLAPGERVDLTDGAGLLAECVVAAVRRDELELDVLTRIEVPAPQPRLVVVQALPKGDRGELAVETMTEVGVDVIVPWAAARCVTQWRGERGAKALGKWRSTAREAAKQARRARIPEVTELASTSRVAELLAAAALPVVLHEEATAPLAEVTPPRSGDLVVVVGPEGGITPQELASFAAVGARSYRLGPTVLRTSTAGVVAAAILLARSGRW